MRILVKPSAPQLSSTSYDAYATALGNALGRFCSFCEKALTYRLYLFHKQHGVIGQNVQLSPADWPDLLLICGDCADCVSVYDPGQSYFWPDTATAQQVPYLYTLVNNVSVTVHDPDDAPIKQFTNDAVLVALATDVDQPTTTAAKNTAALFCLNGKYFNGNSQQPGYTLPYREYADRTDVRLEARRDAYRRGVEAGQALARAIPTLDLKAGEGYVRTLVAMVDAAIRTFGFQSTWMAAIVATLNATDPSLMPQLIALLSGKPVDPSPPRKRVFQEFEEGLSEAPEFSHSKRVAQEIILNQLINVAS